MIKKLALLLRQLTGRVKKHMSNWWMVYSALLFPMGVIVAVIALEKATGIKFYIGMGLAFLFFTVGIETLRYARKLIKKEQLDNEHKFDALINELKGLRQDLKESNQNGKSESNN